MADTTNRIVGGDPRYNGLVAAFYREGMPRTLHVGGVSYMRLEDGDNGVVFIPTAPQTLEAAYGKTSMEPRKEVIQLDETPEGFTDRPKVQRPRGKRNKSS